MNNEAMSSTSRQEKLASAKRKVGGIIYVAYFGFPWLCFLVLLRKEILTVRELSYIQITVTLNLISLSRITALESRFGQLFGRETVFSLR